MPEPEPEDVQPPPPLRTPPRNEVYRYPPPSTEEPPYKEGAYFVEDQMYFDENNVSELGSDYIPSPESATVQRMSNDEIGQPLSLTDLRRVSLYDTPSNNYSSPRPEVDADGVSVSEFSFSPRDDRIQLPSSRDCVPPPRIDKEQARVGTAPRIEVPIPVHPKSSAPVYESPPRKQQQHTRVFSDPGISTTSAWERYASSASTNQQPTGSQSPQQQKQRIFSDLGTVTVSHWERRRDIMLGRNSLPPPGAFDDGSEPVNSSFRVLNVQRVPVGSLELQLRKGRSKEDKKKLKIWRKLKGFVS